MGWGGTEVLDCVRVSLCVFQRDRMSVVCLQIGRLIFIAGKTVGNYLRGARQGVR